MRPRVTVYSQASADGRLDGFAADPTLYYRLGFRWPCDAILMGSVTAQAFGPAESDDEAAGAGPDVDPVPVVPGFEELVRDPRPRLVVVDSRGTVRNWRHARAQPWYGHHLSVVSARTPPEHRAYLTRRDVTVLEAGDDRVDLAGALRLLAERHGVRRVRTDGGGRLTGALLAAGCVDELALLVAPAVSGSPAAPPLVTLPGPVDAPALRLVEVERLEGDHLLIRWARGDRG